MLLPDDDLTKVHDSQFLLDEDPSDNVVIDMVCQVVPLNRKQRLVVKKVIREALALVWRDHPYDYSKRDQFFEYVGGEGGTGKSRIIKAIVVAMTLLRRQHEVILTAPTGSAADNINGNTYHTSLGMSIGKRVNPKAPQRVQRLWAKKTILIIDEISMVDLKTLSDINNRCKIARALSADSPDLFGGLPAVIFMGDFYQFPPVKGLPLWQEPRQGKDDEFAGFHIWRRFTNVIILDEQMRQASDLRFQDLLRRTRKGQLTRADLDLLNSKAIPADGSFHMDSVVSVVKLNSLRHRLNHLAMIQFARRRNQRIYLFPAHHTRLPSMQQFHVETIFEQQDEGVNVPSQGLLLYTPGMPCMILANISSSAGLVNGCRGIATGVIMEPNSKTCPLSLTLLVKVPDCMQ